VNTCAATEPRKLRKKGNLGCNDNVSLGVRITTNVWPNLVSNQSAPADDEIGTSNSMTAQGRKGMGPVSENGMEAIARLRARDPEDLIVELQAENASLRAKLKAHGDILNEYSNHPVVRIITAKIASIK
jgi:hypothetical protein